MAITLDPSELVGLIQPEILAGEGFRPPSRVLMRAGTDHSGADAYYVYLIYPDGVPEDELTWAKTKSLVSWIRDHIWQANGEERWPYVRVVQEADLAKGLF